MGKTIIGASRICPHCNAYALRKAGIKNGYQQYKCTSCKRCSSDSPDLRLSGKTPCKHCNSLHTRKVGFTVTGYQKYKCLDCGKWWSDSPIPKGGLPKGETAKPKSVQDLKRRKEKKNDLS